MIETSFTGRIVLPEEKPPIRAYVHKIGFIEVYGNDLKNAQRHLKQVAKDYKKDFSVFKYILAFMWGQGENKFIEAHGYDCVGKWPGDDMIGRRWIMKNGVLIKNEDTLPIEIINDIGIARDQEEEHRQKRNSLIEYISNPPHFIHDGKGHTKIIPK